MTPRRNATGLCSPPGGNAKGVALQGVALRGAAGLGAAMLAVLLCGAPARGAAGRTMQPVACPAATTPDPDQAPLPHLAVALQPGATLNILVAGSSTPALPDAAAPPAAKPTIGKSGAAGTPAPAPAPGVPAAAPPAFYPWHMARNLEAGVPNLHVTLTVLGGRGQPASDILPRVQAELARRHYQLVLWQTGTVEAVNAASPEDFYETLADGAAAIAAAGADLLLVDPQFSRFLQENANLEPYQDALQAAAALPGVALFHRFDLMQDWAESHEIDLERASRADRPAVALRLHTCLGQALARVLLAHATAASAVTK